ncbi:MAG: VWA domain-containing protein [Vicinamibacteria bacterium]|nr:VWA domain-containing protein [Vicinamibacteria bacterium]
MSPRRVAGVLVLCASLTSAQTTASPQPTVFATKVESVLIDAFVTGDGGQMPGLTARDFILKDNGTRVEFDLLPAESLPLRAILVFDTSTSMQGLKIERLRAAAEAFVDRLRPEDEAALVSFSDEITWRVPLTTDRARLRFGILSLQARGATSAYDALFTALLVPRSGLRTLIVLFSDGEDNMSWLREKQIKGAVERSNALIHVVAAPPVDPRPGVLRIASDAEIANLKTLRGLAAITGGSLIEVASTDRIDAAFAEIIDRMKNRYVLRYTPESDLASGWHTLDLQLVTRKGKVRGRTGYWVEPR